jgi:hypothetical protein
MYRDEMGWSIIPVDARSKRPMARWGKWQHEMMTDEELEYWFLQREADIAIVTGTLSGVVVVDVDNAGCVWNTVPAPATLTQKTKRGHHEFYVLPEGEQAPPSSNGFVKDGDFKAEGGYVIAYPATGKEWDKDPRQASIAPWDRGMQARVELYLEEAGKLTKEPITGEAITSPVDEGNRNDEMARRFGKYAREIDKFDLYLGVCRNDNKANCKPPLDPEEVERTARSIWEREQAKEDEPEPGEEAPVRAWTLKNHQIPEDQTEPILAPWLRPGTIATVYAEPGLGKTWFCLSLAFAVASGRSFLGWNAPARRGVLYVDSEMSMHAMQSRLDVLWKNRELVSPAEDIDLYLTTVMPASAGVGVQTHPNIWDKHDRGRIRRWVRETGVGLVVLDNLSGLLVSDSYDENQAKWIDPLRELVRGFQADGVATLLVHHGQKSRRDKQGNRMETTYRGTSALKTFSNLMIALRGDIGFGECSFDVEFEKLGQTVIGPHEVHLIEPFTCSLTTDAYGQSIWAYERKGDMSEGLEYEEATDIRDVAVLRDEVFKLMDAGRTYKQIAEEMALNVDRIGRWCRQEKRRRKNEDDRQKSFGR